MSPRVDHRARYQSAQLTTWKQSQRKYHVRDFLGILAAAFLWGLLIYFLLWFIPVMGNVLDLVVGR